MAGGNRTTIPNRSFATPGEPRSEGSCPRLDGWWPQDAGCDFEIAALVHQPDIRDYVGRSKVRARGNCGMRERGRWESSLATGRSLIFRNKQATKKQRQSQHRDPSSTRSLRRVEHRLARDGSHVALQIAQALDRILDLSRPAFDVLAGQIARDQTHAMHPVL